MTPQKNLPPQSLEALNQKVDSGFARVDANFARVEANFDRVDKDLRELRGAVGGLNRTLLGAAGGIIGTLILGFVSVLIAVLT